MLGMHLRQKLIEIEGFRWSARLTLLHLGPKPLQLFLFHFQHPQPRTHHVAGRRIAPTFHRLRYEIVKVIAQNDRGVARHGLSPSCANIPILGTRLNPPPRPFRASPSPRRAPSWPSAAVSSTQV